MTDFATIAAQAPKHDPASCTRRPCRRCMGDHTPTPPEVGPNPHNARPARRQPPRLAGVTPEALIAAAQALVRNLESHGTVAWQNVEDWRREQRHLTTDSTRGGGSGEHAANQARDRREEERVSQLYDRLTAAVTAAMDAITLVDTLVTETIPLRTPKTKPALLAAQIAAEGWCRSCYRDDQHLEPITTRPDGTPFFRDLCKWCGYWQAEHGQLPSADVLRQRHQGRRIRRTT